MEAGRIEGGDRRTGGGFCGDLAPLPEIATAAQNSFQETLSPPRFLHRSARGMNPENPTSTSAELVRRAVREFETPLTGYAAGITHDFEAARDVVQDTFLKLYIQEDPARL